MTDKISSLFAFGRRSVLKNSCPDFSDLDTAESTPGIEGTNVLIVTKMNATTSTNPTNPLTRTAMSLILLLPSLSFHCCVVSGGAMVLYLGYSCT